MSYIKVQVIRPPGTVIADDIIDPLCTTEVVAVERGRVFIDEHYAHKVAVDSSGPYEQWIPPGSLLSVVNTLAPSYYAQVIGTTIAMSRDDESMNLDISLKMERLDDQ